MDLNFLKQKRNFKKKKHEANPDLFWKILLIITIILLIASLTYSLFFFLKIKKDFSLPEIETNFQKEKNRQDKIEKILQYFNERAEKSENILQTPSPVIDPSR